MKHNHVTRDIKPRGQCPACDAYHDHAEAINAETQAAEDEANEEVCP